MSSKDPRDPAEAATPDVQKRLWGTGTRLAIAEDASRKPIVAVYASIPLGVLAIIWLARSGHLGTTPIWILGVVLGVTGAANLAAFMWLRERPGPGVPMQTRLAVAAFSTAAVVYAAGWGSIIVIGYAVGIAEIVRSNGAETWRGALGWNAVAILGGELAVQFHLAPSIVSPGTSHEAAIFGFCCLALVTRVLVLTSSAAEIAEQQLRERSERFESLVAHASDVIGAVDGSGNITFLSPAVETLLGYTPAELEGTPFADVIDTADADEVRRILDELSASPNAIDRRDVRFRHRVGHERRVVVTFTSRDAGGDDTVVINLHDVTVERALEDRLRFDAMHDPLTGTWNRAAFTEATDKACAAGARDGGTIALLFIDVDGFKQINDTLGHDRGDELLTHVARTIQSCLRGGNILGRWGGDEFVVLLSNVSDSEDAIVVADRILVELDGVTNDSSRHPRTTVSIGIATSTNGTHSAATLVLLADEAMYTAKRDGRARWAVSPASPHIPTEVRAQTV